MVRGSPNPRHFRLPARLRSARRSAALTRNELVQSVGAGQTAVSEIEAGKRLPTVGMIARLAVALGVSAGWLAYGLGDERADGPAANCDGMGMRVQEVRAALGMPKAELARRADLSPRTISNIENGAQAGIEVIDAMATVLNVSPAWLAFKQGPRELPKRRRTAKLPDRKSVV